MPSVSWVVSIFGPDDGGAPYDAFRDRIMFPIRDARGRAIAFGARAMDPADPAKYLNSPETPLFDKGRTLYNLHRAAPAARQSGRIIVVEGYMDAVTLSQHGFTNVVATLGTALTAAQGITAALLARPLAEQGGLRMPADRRLGPPVAVGG